MRSAYGAARGRTAGNRDNASVIAIGTKRTRRGAGDQKGAAQIRLDNLVPFLDGHVAHRCARPDARVRNHYVKTSQSGLDLLEHARDVRFAGDVCLEAFGGATRSADAVAHRSAVIRVRVRGQAYGEAIPCKTLGYSGADAARAAGDERNAHSGLNQLRFWCRGLADSAIAGGVQV